MNCRILSSFLVIILNARYSEQAPGLYPLDPVDLCVNDPFVIPFNYTDEDRILFVSWFKDGVQVMFQTGGDVTVINSKYALDSETNAAIKILNVEASSGGSYTCSVDYEVGFALPSQEIVTATVINDEPGTIFWTRIDDNITCLTNASSSLVKIRIKVNNATQPGASYSPVLASDKVECCAIDEIAKCADGNYEHITPFCILVQEGGTTTTTTSTTTTSITTPATTSTSQSMTSISLTSNTTPTPLASTVRSADPDSTTRTTTADIFSTSPTAATTTSAGTSASASLDVTSTKKILSPKSDKDLITMIIVVSVIGGILVLAVFMLIFSWVHWSKYSLQKPFGKKRSPSSYYTKNEGHHDKHNSGGIYSTTQIEDKMKDYYFYTGKINPVYDGTVVTSYVYSNEETTFHGPEHTEQFLRGVYNYDFS